MTHVQAFGQKIEIPAGHDIVIGPIQDGDRGLAGTTTLYWTGELNDLVGAPASDWYPVVIRPQR